MDGKISVPSGHLDQGETIYAAASREVMEEAGVSVDPASWKTLAVMHRRTATRTYIDFFLEASEWIGTIRNGEPEKASWVDMRPLSEWRERLIDFVACGSQHSEDEDTSELKVLQNMELIMLDVDRMVQQILTRSHRSGLG